MTYLYTGAARLGRRLVRSSAEANHQSIWAVQDALGAPHADAEVRVAALILPGSPR